MTTGIGCRFDVVLNRSEDLEPVDFGHLEIQEHDRGIALLPGGKDSAAIEVVEDFSAVVADDHFVGDMMFFHGGQRKFGVTRVVFGEQDGFDSRHVRGLVGGSDKERRALVGCPFGPGPSTMAMDDSAHIGETDAGAFKLIVPMEPLKDAE